MKTREAEAVLWAANPIGRTEALELHLEAGEGEMLAAIAAEPVDLERPPRASRSGRLLRANPRLATALAILLALVAFIVLTPPGHAVAGWVGEQLGLSGPGEPGGPPALQSLREKWTQGTSAEGQPATVLIVGPAPRGDRYELITFRTKREPGKSWPANGARCFEVDITKVRFTYGGFCGVLPGGSNMRTLGIAGNSDPDQELYLFAGQASYAVDSIEASFKGEPVEVQLEPIPPRLAAALRIKPFQFFIAFFEDAFYGGAGELVARDAEGRVLARRRFEIRSHEPMARFVCRSVLRTTRHPGAMEDCRQMFGPPPW